MKLAPALLLAVVPLSSGCALLEASFEPVFTPAVMDLGVGPAVEVPPSPPAPRPVELCRAARTRDGVWHFEARLSDGSVRHHVWDVAHPGLRARAAEGMARWDSPAWFVDGTVPLLTCGEPWPADALQLFVLGRPGEELPAGEPEAILREASWEVFSPLAEQAGQPAPLSPGPGTVVRLARDGLQVEVTGPGGWVPLACYPQPRPPATRHAQPRAGRVRVVEGAVKAALIPPALALDAGYLTVLGASKVVAGVLTIPAVLLVLGFWGGGRWC